VDARSGSDAITADGGPGAAPFRWAILGTGDVARKFALAIGSSPSAGEAHVVASRDRANATRLAELADIGHVAADYEEAIRAAEVDGVYIATPPSTHRALALAAIEAGRAVLVEKPFAADGDEAAEIAAAARAADVFCMEGMWTRFLPLLDVLRARLADGSLGPVSSFEASFCGPVVGTARRSILDPERGGGALLHRGVYPLSLARDRFGPVAEIEAMARAGPTGVDEEVVLHLRHEGGTLSSLRASFAAPGRNDMVIAGREGTLTVQAPIYRPWAMTEAPARPDLGTPPDDGFLSVLREGAWAQGAQQRLGGLRSLVRRARAGRTVAHYAGNGYAAEAEAVVRDVAAGRTESATMPLDQSVEIMELVDRARASRGWCP
jgi:predicted dehydrogenase